MNMRRVIILPQHFMSIFRVQLIEVSDARGAVHHVVVMVV